VGQPCGTTYCAAGWAALDPWFQKETPMLDYFALVSFDKETLVVPRDLRDGFHGLSTVFNIESADTEKLFGGCLPIGCQVSQAAVIANIDRLLHSEETIPYAEGEGYIPFEDEEELDEGDEDEEEDEGEEEDVDEDNDDL
jgi:hypothetical protein